jgi:hypothetical protein
MTLERGLQHILTGCFYSLQSFTRRILQGKMGDISVGLIVSTLTYICPLLLTSNLLTAVQWPVAAKQVRASDHVPVYCCFTPLNTVNRKRGFPAWVPKFIEFPKIGEQIIIQNNGLDADPVLALEEAKEIFALTAKQLLHNLPERVPNTNEQRVHYIIKAFCLAYLRDFEGFVMLRNAFTPLKSA